MTEDEMVGWHDQLNGHGFEQAPGDGEGQGSLACCSPWGHKESDTTERLNDKEEPKKKPEGAGTSEEVYFFFYAHDFLLEELWGQRPTRFHRNMIQDLRNLDGVGGVDIY